MVNALAYKADIRFRFHVRVDRFRDVQPDSKGTVPSVKGDLGVVLVALSYLRTYGLSKVARLTMDPKALCRVYKVVKKSNHVILYRLRPRDLLVYMLDI